MRCLGRICWLRTLCTCVLISLCVPLGASIAADGGDPYQRIDTPVDTRSPGKIEVVEWFWYASPNCRDLTPVIEQWVNTQPEDVAFRRLPAVVRDEWAVLANMFFAFQELGVTETMHARLYDAVVSHGLNWVDERYLFDWVDRQGLDVQSFAAVFRSDQVYRRRLAATQLGRELHVDVVPAYLVQGMYLVTPQLAGGVDGITAALDKAIAAVRNEKRP